MIAWHFLKDDGTTAYGGLKPKAGKILRAKGPLVICDNGMHASIRAIDALGYAQGAIVERVEMVGKTIERGDKICARGRKTVWMYDATYELHEFACREALRALRKAKFTDQRCYEAIATKRRWMKGKVTDEELDAARDAARDAASAAARAAAWVAARDAASAAARVAARDAASAAVRAAARVAARVAARDAAWAAARVAAWVAARDAARDAVWSEAWAAARDAAWAAARAAAMGSQNRRLEKMLIAGAAKRGLIEESQR